MSQWKLTSGDVDTMSAVSLIHGLWSVKSRVWGLKLAGRKDMPVRFLSSWIQLESTLKHKSRRSRLVRIAVRNTVELFPPGRIMIWMVITPMQQVTNVFHANRHDFAFSARTYESPRHIALLRSANTGDIPIQTKLHLPQCGAGYVRPIRRCTFIACTRPFA